MLTLDNLTHTPGPWEARCRDLSDTTLIVSGPEPNYREIAVIRNGNERNWTVTDRIDVLNAQLLAAAPELLEALQGLVNVCTHPQSTKADMRMIANEARAIIAKAQGTA